MKNLILRESSARAWLKGYLASKNEVSQERLSKSREKTEKLKGFLMKTHPKNIQTTIGLLANESPETKQKAKHENSSSNLRFIEKSSASPKRNKAQKRRNDHPLKRIFARTNNENTQKLDKWMIGRRHFLNSFNTRAATEANDHTALLESIDQGKSSIREGESSPLRAKNEEEKAIPMKLSIVKLIHKNPGKQDCTHQRARSAGRLSKTLETEDGHDQSRPSHSPLKTIESYSRNSLFYQRSTEKTPEKVNSHGDSSIGHRPVSSHAGHESLAIKTLHHTISKAIGKPIMSSPCKTKDLSQHSNIPKSFHFTTQQSFEADTEHIQGINNHKTNSSKEAQLKVVSPYPMFFSKKILRSNHQPEIMRRDSRSVSAPTKPKGNHSSTKSLTTVSFEHGYQLDKGFKFITINSKHNGAQGKHSSDSLVSETAPTDQLSHEGLNNSQLNGNFPQQLRRKMAKKQKERSVQKRHDHENSIKVADLLISKTISISHPEEKDESIHQPPIFQHPYLSRSVPRMKKLDLSKIPRAFID